MLRPRASNILMFLAFIQFLTTSYLVSMKHVNMAPRGDRIFRFGFPLVFAALVVDLFYR